MGIGGVVHTLNPRLFLPDLEYIINHAQDKILILDLTFLELIKKLQPKLKSVEAFVVLTDSAHMPKQGLKVGVLHSMKQAQHLQDIFVPFKTLFPPPVTL